MLWTARLQDKTRRYFGQNRLLTQTVPSGKIMPAWGVVPFAPVYAAYADAVQAAGNPNLMKGLDQHESAFD
jgi:hypothetical protein